MTRRRGNMPAVRSRLREVREAKGLTQAQLAQQVGVSAPAISLVEGDSLHRPELGVALRMAIVLGVSVHDLFTLADPNWRTWTPPPREPGPVTAAMTWAIVLAAADPQGRIPERTGGTVLGDLYEYGWAERATAEHPRRITPAGYRWVHENPDWVECSHRGEHDLIEAALAAAAEHVAAGGGA